MALNKYLAREAYKGWVVRRWKLHAVIGKGTKWNEWWHNWPTNVYEVSLGPSGKVISNRVSDPIGLSFVDVDQSYYRPCKYCRCREDWSGNCEARCGGTTGELVLFP